MRAKKNSDAATEKNLSRKPAGTRLGTIQDWRDSTKSGKVVSRYGVAVRDGR